MIVIGAFSGLFVVYGVSLAFKNLPAIREYLADDESNGEALALARRRPIRAKLTQPLVPHLGESIINETDGRALAEFFGTYACPPDGPASCIMDLSSHSSSSRGESRDRIAHLRHLAKAIVKSTDTQCGSPRILLGEDRAIDIVGSTDVEFCFWVGDYVSNEAMRDFSFEASDWRWVVRAFRDPKVRRHHECLAFLDAGVNVGDWAVPITGSLPTVAYFGIEGSPPTAAISAANILAMIRHQKQHRENITHLATRALVPFPVMSERGFKEAEKNGGVCFDRMDANVGGQSIKKGGGVVGTTLLRCDARSTAGAAYFPAVLRNLAAQFQPSCARRADRPATSSGNHWPSIYIAKFDIQGYEFESLSPAVAWLEERPPCYMMLEFSNKKRQNYALMELLVNVVGYDSVWRSSFFQDPVAYEQPPSAPHWSKRNGTELWTVYEQDMKDRVDWSYANYIFGFADQEACIERLLGHS